MADGGVQLEGRLANVSAALLLGGSSSRMGRDKARLELAGKPFATRIAERLHELFEDVMLVGGDPPAGAPGRAVADPADSPRCALRGLVGALEASREQRVLVVATDLPLVTPELLLGLVAWPEADAVVPRTDDGLHPLCAVYRCENVLPVAKRRLADGERKLSDLLGEIDTHLIEGSDLAHLDPDGRALWNVNTPDDLEAIEG